jgi:hypothetical protein
MDAVQTPYQPAERSYQTGRQPGSYIGFINMIKARGGHHEWFRDRNGIKLGLVLYKADGKPLFYARGVNSVGNYPVPNLPA